MPHRPKLLIITGATAAGKSAFIYRELTGLPLTIINADSRQVYSALRVSSAGPSDQEMQLFPHRLYHFLPENESFSAGAFIQRAAEEIAAAHEQGRLPVLCGGTYFYIHALLSGLLPPLKISEQVTARVAAMPADEAYALLREIDPAAAEKIHAHNLVRLRRALAVCLTAGRPMSSIPREGAIRDKYDILMLIFDTAREQLLERVRQRVQGMFRAGLVAEVTRVFASVKAADRLSQWRSWPALTGIGIREFFESYEVMAVEPDALDALQLETVSEAIVRNTMALVKRQRTWFRNAPDKPGHTKTVDPAYENERIAALAKDFLH